MRAIQARIGWVDIGKYICIMLVMLTHLESGNALIPFYLPFILELFFFFSGYVYVPPASFRDHMKKKFRGLFVPWLVFSHFNLLLSMVVTLKGERDYLAEFFWNLLQIRARGDGLWFVAALFLTFVPFYFVIRMDRPKLGVAVTFVLAQISLLYAQLMPPQKLPWGSNALPWHVDYIFYAMLWMVFGYYFRLYGEERFDRWNVGINKVLIWLVYAALIYLPRPEQNLFFTLVLINLRAVLGILACVSLCKSVKTNWYFSFVGANTLTYFALHGKVFAVIEALLRRLGGQVYIACLNNPVTSSLMGITITLVLSVILIVPAYIVNRWFPWVLGRKPRKKAPQPGA